MAKLYASIHHAVVVLFLVALLPVTLAVNDILGPSTAGTTRYWDCCKPSCAWHDKAVFDNAIQSCGKDNTPQFDDNLGTGCNGGVAYACAANSPWAVNDTFSYGFVGTFLIGGDESKWCCSCYQFNFTSGPAKGKSMIVQSSNTIYDNPSTNIFTLGIPGGNTSYAGACGLQFGVSNSVFGPDKVGLVNRTQCDDLPKELQPGCKWRFDWFLDSSDPNVEYKRVTCPKELTDISRCTRADDETFMAPADGKSAASTLPISPLATSALCAAGFLWMLQQLLG